jgi:hypothetical protein
LVEAATAQRNARRRNGRISKRAKDRPIVRAATLGNQGRPHYSLSRDNRRLVERLASWIYICTERNATEASQHAIHLYSSQRSAQKGRYGHSPVKPENYKYLKAVGMPQRISREAV